MSKDVLLTWKYPTHRVSGAPLDPAAIAGVEIGLRVVGDTGPFSTFPLVAYPAAEFTQTELAEGDYDFQCVVVLHDGRKSEPRTVRVSISDVVIEPPPADDPPAPVEDFKATVL